MQLPTGDVLLLILERVAVADVLAVGATCKGTMSAHCAASASCAQRALAAGPARAPTRLTLSTSHFAPRRAALHELTSEDVFWRGLAERKWGPSVLELRPAGEEGGASWKAYAIKRMNLRTIR